VQVQYTTRCMDLGLDSYNKELSWQAEADTDIVVTYRIYSNKTQAKIK